MNTGRCTFSLWATNTGKNSRWISTFHSTGGALCRSFFVNIVHIYRVSIRAALGLGVWVGLALELEFGLGLVLDLRLVLRDKTPL